MKTNNGYFTERELRHMAELIKIEVSYFNGWAVSQEKMDED